MDIVNKSKKARKSGADRDELDSLAHEAHMVDLYSDHNIRAFQSRYLLKKAERYLLPIPPFDKESGNWEKSEIAARWRLTLPAHAELRSPQFTITKRVDANVFKVAERHHRCIYRPTGHANCFNCYLKLMLGGLPRLPKRSPTDLGLLGGAHRRFRSSLWAPLRIGELPEDDCLTRLSPVSSHAGIREFSGVFPRSN